MSQSSKLLLTTKEKKMCQYVWLRCLLLVVIKRSFYLLRKTVYDKIAVGVVFNLVSILRFAVNSTVCILQHHLRMMAFLISLKSSTPRGFALNLLWLKERNLKKE